MSQQLTVSTAPHLHHPRSKTENVMKIVTLALLPPTLGGIYYFGINALLIILTSVITCVLTEYIAKRLRKQPFINDYSAIVTGLLLALILPPTAPLWMVVLGAGFAIAIAKEAFGGLGYNIFNPALAGRAFLAISFALSMTNWVAPQPGFGVIDAVTTATPLSESFSWAGTTSELYTNMFLGNIGGCIGETSALLILIGGLILLITRVIKWHVPVVYIGTVFVLTALLPAQDPLFHILAGGLFLGAFYMATDYTTTPMTVKGQIIFALGAGIMVVLIRVFGSMPEGVAFSILLMNGFTPIIDRYVRQKPYGYIKPERKSLPFFKKEKDEECEECDHYKKDEKACNSDDKKGGGKA